MQVSGNEKNTQSYNSVRKVGIWFGFKDTISIKREGIGRYVQYIVEALVRNTDVKVEIWASQNNVADLYAVYEKFGDSVKILSERDFVAGQVLFPFRYLIYYYNYFIGNANPSAQLAYHEYVTSIAGNRKIIERLVAVSFRLIGLVMRLSKTFCSVNNFSQFFLTITFYLLSSLAFFFIYSQGLGLIVDVVALMAAVFSTIIFLDLAFVLSILVLINILNRSINHEGLLAGLANDHSNADIFFLPVLSLENGLLLNHPKVVAALDLFPVVYQEEFVNQYKLYDKNGIQKILNLVEKYAKTEAVFLSNSEQIRTEHFLKNIQSLKPENTAVVPIPTIVPSQIEFIPEEEIRKNYNIKGDYLFYPTIIRPHKNMVTLFKAIQEVKKKYPDIKLVLTCDPQHFLLEQKFLDSNDVSENLVIVNNASEKELLSLYKYATACVIPTFEEAGFPLQAMEAIYLECPVVISDISVVREKLRYNNISEKESGLLLFNKLDHVEFAEQIIKVINNRKEVVSKQKVLRKLFTEYTWDVAIHSFLKIFNLAFVNKNGSRK